MRDRRREQQLLELLTLDDDGCVIYEGRGPVNQRTGSPARLLIDWFLYKDAKEKPLDADLFEDYAKKLLARSDSV